MTQTGIHVWQTHKFKENALKAKPQMTLYKDVDIGAFLLLGKSSKNSPILVMIFGKHVYFVYVIKDC